MPSEGRFSFRPLSGIRARLQSRAGSSARFAPTLHDIARGYDVRSMTPREMAALSSELYLAGLVDREAYTELSFQPELMPNYDTTVGALTGEKAAPDRPRDYTRVWKERLRFELAHPDDPNVITRTRRILELLRELESMPNLPVAVREARLPEPVSVRPEALQPRATTQRQAAPPAEQPRAIALPSLSFRAAPEDKW